MSKNNPVKAEEALSDRTSGVSRTRTDDPLLAKQVLYQLSYNPERKRTPDIEAPKRWDWEELNLRPHAYQACALTT